MCRSVFVRVMHTKEWAYYGIMVVYGTPSNTYMVWPRMTEAGMVTRVQEGLFKGDSHAIAYCTNASSGLSAIAQFHVCFVSTTAIISQLTLHRDIYCTRYIVVLSCRVVSCRGIGAPAFPNFWDPQCSPINFDLLRPNSAW